MSPWNVSDLTKRLSVGSKHVAASVVAHTTVSPTQGFHLTSSTKISNLSTLPQTCFAALLQLVPADFIVDEYELNQRYKEGYGPLCHVVGEKDLELPVEAVGNRSALILAEFSHQSEATLDIPLHLRYARPQHGVGIVELELPWPWVVAVCDKPDWDGRQFLHRVFKNEPVADYSVLSPSSDAPHPSSSVFVPTGDISHQFWVELGTLLSVVLTFSYVAWRLFKSVRTAETKIKNN